MKKTILTLILALSLQGLAAASAADNDYIMCPGDQLQVVVYGHEDLSSPPNSNTTPYTVRPDGKVTFPLIGRYRRDRKNSNRIYAATGS